MAISLRFSKKERKRKSQQSALHDFFLTREDAQHLPESQISALLHGQKRSMQGHYSGTKTFSLGSELMEVNVKNLIFFISLHLMDSHSINAVFKINALFQSFKCNNITLFMSILRGDWNVTHSVPTD